MRIENIISRKEAYVRLKSIPNYREIKRRMKEEYIRKQHLLFEEKVKNDLENALNNLKRG